MPPPSEESLRAAQLAFQRHQAQEHRRKLMQGLGRPILSFVPQPGHRAVLVGDRIYGPKNWVTFHDFLFDYIKEALTREWGSSEFAKTGG